MAGTRSWREVRGERALNEARVQEFRRLMDAQRRIAEALAGHGVSEAQIEVALTAAEAAVPTGEQGPQEFYLEALRSYVVALGGRLERGEAVFAQAIVQLLEGGGEDGREGGGEGGREGGREGRGEGA